MRALYGKSRIDDVEYLIEYVFAGGPPPCMAFPREVSNCIGVANAIFG